ncbi:MAG: class I SAM-dependent methyltransferase [Thermoanaerobaculia bacterium]
MNWIEGLHGRVIVGRRVESLAKGLAEFLPAAGSVLDVGAGDGKLAWRLQQGRSELRFCGVDVLRREETLIDVIEYDGRTLPFGDRSFDAVVIVDVLHHAGDPRQLLIESARVSRQRMIVKDHLCENGFDRKLLSFMDSIGNRRFGVASPGRYMSRHEWNEMFGALPFSLKGWIPRLHLYPWPLSAMFERNLHFVALLERSDEIEGPPPVHSRGQSPEKDEET